MIEIHALISWSGTKSIHLQKIKNRRLYPRGFSFIMLLKIKLSVRPAVA